MKLTLHKTDLLPLLTRINNIVDQKSPQKIRSHILLHADAEQLTLTGADSEIRMVGHLPANIAISGGITVNSQRFFDIIRNAPSDEVEIQTTEGLLLITSQKNRAQLTTMPVEEFPLAEEHSFDTHFTLPESALIAAMSTSKLAMGVNDIRHYLNGQLLDFKADKIVLAATDGHRLTVSELENTSPLQDKKVIIPRKTVLELCTWLGSGQSDIDISFSASHLRFAAGALSLTTALINAEFPNYASVIPEEDETCKIIIPKTELKAALTRAKVIYTEQSIGITLNFEPWVLSIAAKNLDNETMDDKVDINYDGEKRRAVFNVFYLLDILNALKGENVAMFVRDSQNSALLMDQDDANARHVVMPMNM